MAELSFNIWTKNLEETVKYINGIADIKLMYAPLIRNDIEHHIFVEGHIDGISKLAQYLSTQK
jgi:hypothetical protein